MTWPNVIAANRAKKGSAAVSRRNRPPATSSTPSTRRGFAPAKSATIENNNPTAVAGDAHAYRRSRPTDLIRAWITHLALSAAFGPTMTEVVATDCHTVFGEVAEPMALLDELVTGYRAALREPLPFFAQASHAFVAQAIRLETSTRAFLSPLESALARLRCRTFADSPPGDLDDAYTALCWRGRDLLADAGAEFERRATAFWRPAMRATRDASEVAE